MLTLGFPEGRFVRFLLVGGLNTAFGYGVFAIQVLVGVHYVAAAFFSTVLGVLFNFRTTGSLVFGNRDDRLLLRFVLVYAFTYVIGVTALGVAKGGGVPVLIAAAVLQLPMSYLTYSLQRALVFRNHSPTSSRSSEQPSARKGTSQFPCSDSARPPKNPSSPA